MKSTQSLGWGHDAVHTSAIVWAAFLVLLAAPATAGAIENADRVELEPTETADLRSAAIGATTTYAYFESDNESGRMVEVDLVTGARRPVDGDPTGTSFAYFSRSVPPRQGVGLGPASSGTGLPTTNCGTTERVAVAPDGSEADGVSAFPEISNDGRFVAFQSVAGNLVPNDSNGQFDVFVRNRASGFIELVSVATDGSPGDLGSGVPSISADGRFVAFQSRATTLVANDTNGVDDIFVHDRDTGFTGRVSVATDGTEADGGSQWAAISGDGRFVAFESLATNLVPNDFNGRRDVFVHDRETGVTERVSIASDGSEGGGGFNLPVEMAPTISADGRYVAFFSDFDNLVPDDTNQAFDVFVHDRVTGATERVSVDSDGNQGTGGLFASYPAISADGRFVSFSSIFSNLVPGDTNDDIDVFAHDRETGVTERVSVASDGTEGNHPTQSVGAPGDISSDGRIVAFVSLHLNLVPEDTNDIQDVFVHDRVTGSTRRVSVSSECTEAEPDSGNFQPAVSGDSRHVAFVSVASNLVPDDTNGVDDVFFHSLPDLEISPFPLDFGPVRVGQTRGPLSLTVTNGRQSDLTVEAISDPEAPFAAVGGTCQPVPFTLEQDASCTLDFSFSPTSEGPAETLVTFTSDAADGPHTVTLRGIGTVEPLHIAPDPLDFGEVITGETGGPLGVTLTNADESTGLMVTAVSAPAAPFAASGGTCGPVPFSLDPFATCTLEYTFSPTERGGFSEVVEVTSDATSGPLSFTLEGEALLRELTVDPALLDFGDVAIGETAGPLSATVTNTGDVEVLLIGAIPPGPPFSIAEDTCGGLLPPEASCTVAYDFGPSAPGDFSATAAILIAVLNVPPPTVTLQGTGLGATLGIDPESLSTTLTVGQTETQALTVSNVGNATLEWQVTEEGAVDSVTMKPHRPARPSTAQSLSSPHGTMRDWTPSLAPFAAAADGRGDGAARSWTDPRWVPSDPDPTATSVFRSVGSLTFYDDRGAFQAANPGLTLEDFGNTNVPPDNASSCPPPFNSDTDNACFSPGDIVPGVSMDVTLGGGDGQAVVLTPTFAGVPCVSVGPDTFADHADWEFDPPVVAVGLDMQSDLPGQVFTMTVYRPGGQLGSTEVTTAGVGSPVFFGVETSDPLGISRIEVRGPGEQAELFCDVEFGGETVPLDCTLPDWVNPLPTSGSVPAGQEQVVDVTFDTAGLSPGDFTANLCLTSNDPAHALTVVPLALTVTDGGDEGFTPMALAVDAEERVSDGNDIFEPGELVDVAPSWLNDGEAAQSLMGEASSFTGPAGADYELAIDGADYGLIEPGAIATCLDTEACYRLGINDPAVRPATHWEASFTETLDDTEATSKTWSLHVGASFPDVPPSNLFYPAVETLLHYGVTGGCSADAYCPAGSNTRGQMAVFLLKAALGGDHLPSACVEDDEAFDDVPFDSLFCPWIEELSSLGITSGCGGGNYCPADTVTRAQMAIFLLKAAEGGGYTPPPCMSEFGDVPCSSPFAAWIEELSARGITAGCGGGNYCPAAPVTRAQMAVFVTKTFGLTLYGP